MTEAPPVRTGPPPPGAGAAARPSVARLLPDQLGYAVRDLWRTRIAFVFTFLFPLTFLVVLGAIAGNDTVSADSSVRVMQFVTPAAAVMGALYGSFPTVASSLADARERGVLKRVRGTPLPGWVHLAGRIGAAVLLAVGSLTLMLVVGVVAYDVQVPARAVPAAAVTVVAAVACFAALGVAVAGLAPSATVAQAVSIAAAVVVSFLSGVMGYGDMPAWADRIAQVFPVKPFNDALGDQLDPFATGAGWDLGALAVIGAWTAAAVAVAVRWFRWEPVPARGQRQRQRARRTAAPVRPAPVTGLAPVAAGWPTRRALLLDQARWATRAALRDPGWVFFAVAMPVGLYAFNAAVVGDAGTDELSPPLGLQSATGLVAWAAMVNTVVTLPEAVARARDRGVLKRLRGTPLEVGLYFGGRLASALLLVLVTAVLVLLVGVAWFDLRVAVSGLAVAAALLVLGTAALAACGLLLVTVLPGGTAVTAVGLGVSLPLAFFSDVFAIEAVPSWMGTVGSFFPLKHLANSLSHALDPAGPTVDWVAPAVLTAWLVGAGLLAAHRFRWSSG